MPPQAISFEKFEIHDRNADRLDQQYVHVTNEEMSSYQNKPVDNTKSAAYIPELTLIDGSRPADIKPHHPFATVKEFAGVSMDLFDVLDKDRNGALSKNEIIAATQDPYYRSGDAQAVATLYANFNLLAKNSNLLPNPFDSSISRGDLASLARDTPDNLGAYVNEFSDKARDSARREAQFLYPTETHSIADISPDAIHQGNIGDCYFLAPLAAVAKSNPEIIQQMIKDNRDGTYTVTFPGDPGNPVTVKAPTQTEMVLFNPAGKFGSWVSVLEKAFGEYQHQADNKQHPDFIDMLKRAGEYIKGDNHLTAEGADGGGNSALTMRLLTGNKVDSFNARDVGAKDMSILFDSALNSHSPRAVAARISRDSSPPMGFATEHAYSIVAFERTPDGDKVTIRNPWAQGQDSTEGTIIISLRQFLDNFDQVILERPRHDRDVE